MLEDQLKILGRHENLSFEAMAQAVDQIMQGRCAADTVGRWLLALREKGESVDEVAGAADAMRRHMIPIRSSRTGLLDTCGTGGDGAATFNISTAAALVAAAAGTAVAKHGNRSITSKSGSADVLAALGVNVEAPVAVVERCLDELGICFCFAPQLHPAMKHVAPIRRQLGVPTVFNLLGPLCNPAGAPFQLLGVGRHGRRELLAAALARLGTEHALVVTGQDGLDELTLATASDVTEVDRDGVREFTWEPEQFGLAKQSDPAGMQVDGPDSSATIIRQVLDGQPGPAREIVILNAAAALWTAQPSATLTDCASRAAEAIDRGAAQRLLADLARLTT